MADHETNEEITMSSSTSAAAPAQRLANAWRVWVALAVALAVATLGLWASGADPASAKSEIYSYTSEPTTTQAGGHPDIATTFVLGHRLNQPSSPCFCNDPKDVILHAPTGVVANPHVVSTCRIAEMALFECPADAQAGIVVLKLFAYGAMPLWRVPTAEGQAGAFAFALPFGISVPQYIIFNARTGSDYGLDIKTIGISHLLPLDYFAPIFWGVPGAEENDIARYGPEGGAAQSFDCAGDPTKALVEKNEGELRSLCPFTFEPCCSAPKKAISTSIPVAPMTQNPTTCVGPLTSSIDTLAYDRETDHAESIWPETTGCDQLSFDPSLGANPTTTQTDTASGLEVDLRVPQFQDPNTPSPSELRENRVTLPPGFSLNPNVADGKVACTDEQSRVGTELEAACPEFSKVGTVLLDSSALPAPISGYIYLGEPKPGNPYRLVLTANGFGTAVKLLGSVHADPQTGQVTTVFEDLPQTPFQRFILHFFGSERGILATPTGCGTYPVESAFTPWAAELSSQKATQFFVLDSGPGGSPCPNGPRPFAPAFQGGAADNTAATHTSLNLRLTRADGEQNLAAVDVALPPGLLAKLKGIPYCSQGAIDTLGSSGYPGVAELASSACPTASQVGTVVSGAGAGTRPVHNTGKVYLAGPHNGAPLSLVVVVPAVSGPYDLGNVAVRVALNVDPETAKVTAVSDPLPQILGGIPLRLRSLQVQLDRPGFVINPTNCRGSSIGATSHGTEGARSTASTHFQPANCASLDFGPKLTLGLGGGIKRRGHPSLRAVLRAGEGEANVKRAVVTLPPNEQLDNSHIDTICTRARFAADDCPAGSVYGHAEAVSPLLDEPLRGPVYLRSSSNELPDLVAALDGQIEIDLVGRIDTVKGALRTTLQSVPDAPVSRFVLNLEGGRKGLLINQKNVCAAGRRAKVSLAGQNGKSLKRRTGLKVKCGSKARRKRSEAGGDR